MTPRPRKQQPGMPEHIDVTKLPTGVYWDASGHGRWYVFEEVAGRKKRKTVAGPQARLSDLHQIADRRAPDGRGTVAWLCAQYQDSPKFRNLAEGTKKAYSYARDVLLAQRTASGGAVGELVADKLRTHHLQRLVDRIESEGTPTKANQVKRYASIVFRWGLNRGLIASNPAQGLEQAKERPRQRLPTTAAYDRVLSLAKQGGQLTARTPGSVAPYLWIVMELGYLCRLRGIETLTLTEAAATADGLVTNRRKGSRDSVVLWDERLRAAWDAALSQRAAIVQARRLPVAMRPDDRRVFLAEGGEPLTKHGLDSAWQRLIRRAIADGVITADERFSLHDLKRKGGTDAAGNKGERQDALGVSDAMMKVYDKSKPRVKPSGSQQ